MASPVTNPLTQSTSLVEGGVVQSRNFEFLRNARGDLAALGGFAEHYAFNDPASALAKLRLFAERVVDLVYDTFRLPKPYQPNLNDLLNEDAFRSRVPTVVLTKLHGLRMHGNKAVHANQGTTPTALAMVDEAIREHAAHPFHAIFAAREQAIPHPDIITEKSLDNIRDERWWLPTVKTTRKSAAEIGAALRPILQAASEIHIVDPYFDAGAKRFRETFAEIVRQATTLPRAVSSNPVITLVTGVERVFKDWGKPTDEEQVKKRLKEEANVAANIAELARRHLTGLVPPGVTVRLIVLKNATRGDPLHNRFVLTDVGAVIVPYGVDDYDREDDHSAKDDLTPMPRGMYEERWAQYVIGALANTVAEPVTISGVAS